MGNYTITNNTDLDEQQLERTIDSIFTFLSKKETDGELVKGKKCEFHILNDFSEFDEQKFGKVKNLSVLPMAGACFIYYYGSYYIFLFKDKVEEEPVPTSNEDIRIEQLELKYAYYLAHEIRHFYQLCVVGDDKKYGTLTNVGHTRVQHEAQKKEKEIPQVADLSFFENDATHFAFQFLLETYPNELSAELSSQMEQDVQENTGDFHEGLEELKEYSKRFFAQNVALLLIGFVTFFVIAYLFFFVI